jgi:transcriptional regulator with XRE-family HTH domain
VDQVTIPKRVALPSAPERRALRKAAGLSGAELASAIGVAPATLYGWERGQEPSGLFRRAYAAALSELQKTVDPGELRQWMTGS